VNYVLSGLKEYDQRNICFHEAFVVEFIKHPTTIAAPIISPESLLSISVPPSLCVSRVELSSVTPEMDTKN
jgi:hypothetical protein